MAEEKLEEKLEEVDLGIDPQKLRPNSISSKFLEEEKAELILLLKEFRDIFAWEYCEMPGLDLGLVVHTLNVDPKAKPVAQLAKVFHTEIEKQIVKEVQKLLAADFIKPIQHLQWLSNFFPLKKKNGQIQCCVDFRNLNRVCPKDEFPLPNMDLLIDFTAGNAMFSLMDKFNEYNQIRMAPKDVEKTAFRMPIRNFYYTVMPFGLKNASATYQCTMTAIFHNMMHQELVDYVDDIIGEIKKARRSCQNVEEGIRKVQSFQVENESIKMHLWSVC